MSVSKRPVENIAPIGEAVGRLAANGADSGPLSYRWRVGDVFTNGKYRWEVIRVSGDLAVLQSCDTSWATTRLLTFDEWDEHGRSGFVLERGGA